MTTLNNTAEGNNRTDLKKTWAMLNKYGIYTEEELNKALKNLKPLDIGLMATLPERLKSKDETLKEKSI